MLNVIMPCAGSGLRLGLPYPKELHFISQQTALIDLSFEKLLPYKDIIGSVTITLAPNKGDIVQYLSRWSSDFYIRFCYFNNDYHEWAGSILSTCPDFGEKNMVMLPDSFLEESADHALAPTFNAMMDSHDIVFAYHEVEDMKRLHSLGAINVSDGLVTDFCDKPDNDLDRFNAYWCSFGFRAEHGRPLLEMMTRSIQRQAVDIHALNASVGCFPVTDYKDLGVWTNVHDLKTAS